jgi:hypothetical protein
MKLLHALTAVLIGFGGAAGAADRLDKDGVFLPAQAIGANGVLEATIDATGDEVLSVHTMIRPASTNIIMMRDRDGYWVNWDGDRNSLVPSAARNDNGILTYKIFQTPPKGVNAMTVTVAYRTPEGLKFGWFDAGVAREGSN